MATVASQGLATALGRPHLHAEQGHDTVARELIGNPARLLDGTADDIEIVIQEEHDIVG